MNVSSHRKSTTSSKLADVPDEEAWACLIWEAARASKWVVQILPDYGNEADIRAKLHSLTNEEAPPALRCLHYMLQTLSVYTRSVKILTTPQKKVNPTEFPTFDQVMRKNTALTSIESLELMPEVRGRVVNLFELLPTLQAINFAKQLVKAQGKISSTEQILARFEKHLPNGEYKSPFDKEAWPRIGWLDRSIMCRALFDRDFVTDLRDWQSSLESDPNLPFNQTFVVQDLLRKYPFLDSNLKTPNKLAGVRRNGRLADITAQVLASEGISTIRELRTPPKSDAGFCAAVFRLNWCQSDEEILESFKRWLGSRPTQFLRYAKGSWSSGRGPEGIELLKKSKKTPITPRRALKALDIWAHHQSFAHNGEADWKAFVRNNRSDFKGTGRHLNSLISSLSREKSIADQVIAQLFPETFSR